MSSTCLQMSVTKTTPATTDAGLTDMVADEQWLNPHYDYTILYYYIPHPPPKKNISKVAITTEV